MKKTIYNLRPYSWIDLLLIGLVAKFSLTGQLIFTQKDISMFIGLMSLWFFFNLVLELRHNYSYRAKSSTTIALISILPALIIGYYTNRLSITFIIISTLLVIIYLFKNKNQILGNLSSIIRGLIQITYFLYALMLYTNTINTTQVILSIIIFLIYTSRALIGDIRDRKHNKEAGKNTFIVNYGLNLGIILIEILVLSSILILIRYFNILITIPLVALCVMLPFYKNGYIMHQLMIIITSFLSINLISYFTNQSLIFTNIIFIGIFLNIVFYPLLKRKSNPKTIL